MATKVSKKKYSKPITSQLRLFEGNKTDTIIPIKQYRKITKDYLSSSDTIIERINYLEIYSRKIIQLEIKKYVKRKK